MSSEGPASALIYPFRSGWGRSWLVGVPLALFCPLGVIPLLGYSVAAVRAVQRGDDARLPDWRVSGRLIADGVVVLLLIVLVSAPFAIVLVPASGAAQAALPVQGVFVGRAYGVLVAGAPLAVVWALVALLVVPPGVARYAMTARVRDVLDLGATGRLLRARFWAWNVAGVPIVTAWAIAVLVLCAGGVGAPFAAFYAILVSAYAASPLADAPT